VDSCVWKNTIKHFNFGTGKNDEKCLETHIEKNGNYIISNLMISTLHPVLKMSLTFISHASHY
jgi:hypothetical protein